MGSTAKKFNTELTDYSVVHRDTTGPYAKDLEVDALIVGAGFGWFTHHMHFLLFPPHSTVH